MNLGEFDLKKKIYICSGKLILKIVPHTNKWIEEKAVRNWFKYRFPRNKVFRWLKSQLNGCVALTGTVEIHRYKYSNWSYCIQYDTDDIE